MISGRACAGEADRVPNSDRATEGPARVTVTTQAGYVFYFPEIIVRLGIGCQLSRF
jgi:hypothetical protein